MIDAAEVLQVYVVFTGVVAALALLSLIYPWPFLPYEPARRLLEAHQKRSARIFLASPLWPLMAVAFVVWCAVWIWRKAFPRGEL